jgi:hypothetical protein
MCDDRNPIIPEFVDAGGNVCYITNASAWVLDRAILWITWRANSRTSAP